MSKVFDLIRARSSVDALAMIAVQHPETAINAAALREELAAADEQINQLARALREAVESPTFMGEPVPHPANRAARMAMDPQHQRDRIAEAQRHDAEEAKPKLAHGVTASLHQSVAPHRCRWFNGKCIDCGRSFGADRARDAEGVEGKTK